jgi:hypothetical protein
MKTISLLLILVGLSVSALEKLPKHSQMKPLTLQPIGTGNEIDLNIGLVLPEDHILNKGAPSAIDIYELIGTSWQKTSSVNLNDFFSVGNSLSVKNKVSLQTSKGPVAIDSTIFHCDNKHTHCVIESFQGTTKRVSGVTTSKLAVELHGTIK